MIKAGELEVGNWFKVPGSQNIYRVQFVATGDTVGAILYHRATLDADNYLLLSANDEVIKVEPKDLPGRAS